GIQRSLLFLQGVPQGDGAKPGKLPQAILAVDHEKASPVEPLRLPTHVRSCPISESNLGRLEGRPMVAPRKTRDAWLIACFLIVGVTATWSIVTHTQVSRHLTGQVKRSLEWEAKLYSEQLEHILHNVKSGLDSTINSQAIKSRDVELVQESLNVLKQSVPSIVRSWVVYDTGEVITSYNTREEYLAQLDWWQAFLASKSVHTLNPSLLNSQVLVGRPTPSENGLAVLVPIIRIATRDSDIARMLVVELDLN